MNRTIKETNLKAFYYLDLGMLKAHDWQSPLEVHGEILTAHAQRSISKFQ